LDISTIANIEASHEECINEVLADPMFAPHIEYIDVSNQTEVTNAVLIEFLTTHHHVKSVGLINVPQCTDFNADMFPDVLVSMMGAKIHEMIDAIQG